MVALVILPAGCSFFHDDLVLGECTETADCFVGQGERCNTETGICEIPRDASPSSRDAGSPPDAPRDAAPPDDAADASDGTFDAGDAT